MNKDEIARELLAYLSLHEKKYVAVMQEYAQLFNGLAHKKDAELLQEAFALKVVFDFLNATNIPKQRRQELLALSFKMA